MDPAKQAKAKLSNDWSALHGGDEGAGLFSSEGNRARALSHEEEGEKMQKKATSPKSTKFLLERVIDRRKTKDEDEFCVKWIGQPLTTWERRGWLVKQGFKPDVDTWEEKKERKATEKKEKKAKTSRAETADEVASRHKSELRAYVNEFHKHFSSSTAPVATARGATIHSLLRECDFPGTGKAPGTFKVELDRDAIDFLSAPTHFKHSADVLTVIIPFCNEVEFGTCRLVCKKWLTCADETEGVHRRESAFIALGIKNWFHSNAVYPVAVSPVLTSPDLRSEFLASAKRNDTKEGGPVVPVAHGTTKDRLESIAKHGLLPCGAPIPPQVGGTEESYTKNETIRFVDESCFGRDTNFKEETPVTKHHKIHYLNSYMKKYVKELEARNVDQLRIKEKVADQRQQLHNRFSRTDKDKVFGVVSAHINPKSAIASCREDANNDEVEWNEIIFFCLSREGTAESSENIQYENGTAFFLDHRLVVPILAAKVAPLLVPAAQHVVGHDAALELDPMFRYKGYIAPEHRPGGRIWMAEYSPPGEPPVEIPPPDIGHWSECFPHYGFPDTQLNHIPCPVVVPSLSALAAVDFGNTVRSRLPKLQNERHVDFSNTFENDVLREL